ncbi:hypothetical protein [Nocardia farcinica]
MNEFVTEVGDAIVRWVLRDRRTAFVLAFTDKRGRMQWPGAPLGECIDEMGIDLRDRVIRDVAIELDRRKRPELHEPPVHRVRRSGGDGMHGS